MGTGIRPLKGAALADAGRALATDYFNLRELDSEIDVVRRSLDLEQKALGLVTARHDLGHATGLEAARQQALLESSATQLELRLLTDRRQAVQIQGRQFATAVYLIKALGG
jgi:hypothetical protein